MKNSKTKVLLVCTLVVCATFFAQAAVWRVNNNAGINANFSNLQAAYTAASSGDTLYIEGSPDGYGNLTLNKTLTIIGTGYFLNENLPTQATMANSILGTIKFNPGSDGSLLMGLTTGNTNIETSNITYKRNHLVGTLNLNDSVGIPYGISNINISQNFIEGHLVSYAGNTLGATNTVVNNNIITGYLTLHKATGSIVYNNFLGSPSYVENVLFENNFSVYARFYQSGVYNNIFESNYAAETDPQGFILSFMDSTNQFSVYKPSVFVYTGGSTDGNYQLKSGSPAIGYGIGGVDCGPFGGSSPYVLSGIPPIPTVYELLVPAVANSSTGLNVTIKAKSRQ